MYDIIKALDELQNSIKKHAYYNDFTYKDRLLEWSDRLNQLTAKLSRRYD